MSEPAKGHPSVIVLDQDDEAEALRIAKVVASKTGRTVTVRDADGKRSRLFPRLSTSAAMNRETLLFQASLAWLAIVAIGCVYVLLK
jgi:hypothetical protein